MGGSDMLQQRATHFQSYKNNLLSVANILLAMKTNFGVNFCGRSWPKNASVSV